MIKVGDTVMRLVASHSSGMKIGDKGTVKSILRHPSGKTYIELKEYPGQHEIGRFIKSDTYQKGINIKAGVSVQDDINWDKVVKTLSDAIRKEENRRYKTELELLIAKRDKLNQEIEILESKEIELDVNKLLDLNIDMDMIYKAEFKIFKQGRSIEVIMIDSTNNKHIAKGTAKCLPEDTFKEEIGIELAYRRCMQNYHKKQINKLIELTY